MTDPSIPILATTVAGLTPFAAIAGLRSRDAQRWSADLIPHRIEVSASFEPSSLDQFLRTMTGLLPSRWERPVAVRGIGVEIVGTIDGISHFLLVPAHQADIVLGQLRASVPGARAVPDPNYRHVAPTLAGELATNNTHEELNVDDPDSVASGILAVTGSQYLSQSLCEC